MFQRLELLPWNKSFKKQILRKIGIWFKHILFDQSLLHKYNMIEVGSDSKP